MFLEDGDWVLADKYCERVLDLEPENALAYLGKLMAELQVTKKELLIDCRYPFDDTNNYKKILRFADNELKIEMEGYISSINTRNSNSNIWNLYNQGCSLMQNADTENDYMEAAKKFKEITGYKDAEQLLAQCLKKAEILHKDSVYYSALNKIKSGQLCDYKAAVELLNTIPDWKDSKDQICMCEQQIEVLQKKLKTIKQKEENFNKILNEILQNVNELEECKRLAVTERILQHYEAEKLYRDTIKLLQIVVDTGLSKLTKAKLEVIEVGGVADIPKQIANLLPVN